MNRTMRLDDRQIAMWLRADDETRLGQLWYMADETRRRHVGDAVHRRGLIEFSNRCDRHCLYCGLRKPNHDVVRYAMSADEIMGCVRQADELGYGTVVLQSGEDRSLDVEWMAELVGRIKAETPLAVTLSLGERTDAELLALRRAGADRYLLRFETSNRRLFERIHPPLPNQPQRDRRETLLVLRELGYEVGSGVMIGIPGQTYDDLVRDIRLFGQLDLDMIGVGPFIPHPHTPLADPPADQWAPTNEQVPNSERMTYKVMALARLVCPDANIPSTTALATLNRANGREKGLRRGANVIMPNLTPLAYRGSYEIYPDKACINETPQQCHGCVQMRIQAIGRTLGTGRGDAIRMRNRNAEIGIELG